VIRITLYTVYTCHTCTISQRGNHGQDPHLDGIIFFTIVHAYGRFFYLVDFSMFKQVWQGGIEIYQYYIFYNEDRLIGEVTPRSVYLSKYYT